MKKTVLIAIIVLFFWINLWGAEEDDRWRPLGVYGAAILSTVTIHEGGHAVAFLATGGSVRAVVPFPHIVDGRLVGGATYGSGGDPFIVSSAGILAGHICFLALTPYKYDIENNFARDVTDGVLSVQLVEFPFYVMADCFFNFRGDTYNISRILKIPNIALLPVALIDTYALYHWETYWYERRGKDIVGESKSMNLPTIRFTAAQYSF